MRSIALLTIFCSFGAIVDRIAVVVGKHPILDSQINRDLRVTSFLNNEGLDFSLASRKKAASRLVDQELIREQIRTGGFPVATAAEADALLQQTQKERYASEAQFPQALATTGITLDELKDRLVWQLTVLRFIDARFRPEVTISDEEVQRYYNARRVALKGSLDEERQTIMDQLAGERVNKLLDDWLADQRKQTRIEYVEKSLQ
jgi:hypothetical protein